MDFTTGSPSEEALSQLIEFLMENILEEAPPQSIPPKRDGCGEEKEAVARFME